MTTENHTCNQCSQSTKYSPCPACGNEQFCKDCNYCNICGPKPADQVKRERMKAAFTESLDNRTNKARLTLRTLRDRLTQIIEDHDRRGWSERSDLPVYFRFYLERGRGSWYVPIDFVDSAMMGLGTSEHPLDVITLRGDENKTIKGFQQRARKGAK